MPRRAVRSASRALALLALAAPACHGCRDDHPFVPYTIGAERGAGDAGPDAAGASRPVEDAGAGAVEGVAAAVAPPGLSSWTLDGVTLQAPAGQVFALALARDFDGDGAKDAFAVTRPADGSDAGRLVFYRGPAMAPSAAIEPPVGLSFSPTCTPAVRLVGIGGRSVLVELGETCAPSSPGGMDRWLAVVAAGGGDGDGGAGGGARVRLAVTIADPPGAPSLSIDADAADRDGDGREDVALRVTIEGGGPPLEPGPRVSATIAWLDRPAGLSREAGETEAAFGALAAAASARAARSSEAAAVPAFVGQVRTLWRATCSESGAARVVGVAGTGGIGCGAARALADLGLAEVRAYATMGDALRAALALDRVDRPQANISTTRRAEAQRWITKIAPVETARGVRAIAAVPMPQRGHEPSWGPLAFEPDGKLLVRTAAGVVRVDPEPGDEAAAPGVDWKPGVTSPDGALSWIEAYDPCDGLSLRATFAPSSGDDVREVALPIRPPLTGQCLGSRGAVARVIPIAWGAGGLEAIVEGEPVLVAPDLSSASPLASFLDQEPPHRGSPRSPDGKTYVVATRAGLLVRNSAGAQLLRARELEGTYGEQRDCVVSDDVAHVACVHDGAAWVGAWGP